MPKTTLLVIALVVIILTGIATLLFSNSQQGSIPKKDRGRDFSVRAR